MLVLLNITLTRPKLSVTERLSMSLFSLRRTSSTANGEVTMNVARENERSSSSCRARVSNARPLRSSSSFGS